jgi:glycosyltransferase involved in cell wall biosynthesis
MRVFYDLTHTGCDREIMRGVRAEFDVVAKGWDFGCRPKPGNVHLVDIPKGPYAAAVVGTPAGLALVPAGVPVVWKCLTDFGVWKRPDPILERAVFHVSPCRETEARWNLTGHPKSVIIEHGIDGEIWKGYRGDGPDAITVGNLLPVRPEKGPEIIRAVQKLLPLDVIGFGNEGFERISGYASSAEVLAETYRSAKVYFNPSTVVVCAVLEAMMTGMPVVTMPPGNFIDLMRHQENCFIAKNIEDAVYWIKLLVRNPGLRTDIGVRARQSVEHRLHPAICADRWGEIIRKAALSLTTHTYECKTTEYGKDQVDRLDMLEVYVPLDSEKPEAPKGLPEVQADKLGGKEVGAPMKTMLAITLAAFAGPQGKPPAEVLKAEKTIAERPDDTEANDTLGRYYAIQGIWDKALPRLVKGSDDFLRILAEKDLAGGDPYALGESWWTGSIDVEAHLLIGASSVEKVELRKRATALRPAMRDRAIIFFAKAWPRLNVPEREKLQKTVIPTFRNSAGQVRGLPTEWEDMPGRKNPKGSGADSTYAHDGRSSLKAIAGASLRSTPRIPVAKGQKISVMAWTLSVDTETADDQIRVRFFGKSAGITHDGPFIPKDLPFWTQVEFETVAPEGTDHIDINVFVGSTKGALWVDGLVVKVDGKEVLQNGGFEK